MIIGIPFYPRPSDYQWSLKVDPDEHFTDELINEISSIVLTVNPSTAFNFKRQLFASKKLPITQMYFVCGLQDNVFLIH